MGDIVPTRPRRSRNAPNVYTPSKSESEASFALNKSKAVRKKIDASLRENDVDIDFKSGTLVLTFSAASFEIFKSALYTYFSKLSDKKINVHNKKSTTGDGVVCVVDQSISVISVNTNTQLYRINIFNTTSRVDANGRQLDEFINVDLPAIFNRLLTVKDTKKLNEQIRNRCKDFLRSADVTVQDNLCDNVSDTNDVVCTNDKIAKGSSSKDAKTASHSEHVVLALKNVNNPTSVNTNRSCNEPTASDKNVSYIQKQSINVHVSSETSKTKPTIRSSPVSNHVHPSAVSSVKTASRSETDVLVLRSTNVPTSNSSVKSTNTSSTEPTANDKNVSYIQKQ